MVCDLETMRESAYILERVAVGMVGFMTFPVR